MASMIPLAFSVRNNELEKQFFVMDKIISPGQIQLINNSRIQGIECMD